MAHSFYSMLSRHTELPLNVFNSECDTPPNLLMMDLSILMCAFQAGQSSTVIENIHTIIAAAAVKFSFDQLTHLFVLIQKVTALCSIPQIN